MPITFRCRCGEPLEAPESRSGRDVCCPACREVVAVPAGGDDAPGSYAVEQVLRCPGCKREWPLATVVCVDCGHNFQTGRKLRTKYRVAETIIEVGSRWAGSSTQYRVYRNGRGKACLTLSSRLLFIPTGTVTYDLGDYNAVYTDFTPGDDENPDAFHLELRGPGARPVVIFNSSNEEKMRELADALAAVGRLEIKRA